MEFLVSNKHKVFQRGQHEMWGKRMRRDFALFTAQENARIQLMNALG